MSISNCSEQRDEGSGEHKAHGTGCLQTIPRNILISALCIAGNTKFHSSSSSKLVWLERNTKNPQQSPGCLLRSLQSSQLNQGMFTHPKMNPRTVSHLQDPDKQLHWLTADTPARKNLHYNRLKTSPVLNSHFSWAFLRHFSAITLRIKGSQE